MIKILTSMILLSLLASCAKTPIGPAVLVLPGEDKDFTQFHNDDVNCRQFARNQIVSSKEKPYSDEDGQQLYDISFMQCMYDKGHRVPVPGNFAYDSNRDGGGSVPPGAETAKAK